MGQIILGILIYLVVINLVAFAAMGIDKRKARWGKQRISEMNLFILAFLGGWIGAMAGMYTFRHKTKKLMFKIGFPVIGVLQIVLVLTILFT